MDSACCACERKEYLRFLIQQAQREKRSVIFKRAESYVKEYRDAEREKIRLTRLSKQEGTYYVPAEPKLVFVVRIKGYATSTQNSYEKPSTAHRS